MACAGGDGVGLGGTVAVGLAVAVGEGVSDGPGWSVGVGVAVGGGVDAGMTVVSSVSELLPGLGSSKLGTEAVFESVPAAVGVTTRLTVAFAPTAIIPSSQTMVLVPVQLPWLGVAETKFTPGGKLSVSVADAGLLGSILDTVMV